MARDDTLGAAIGRYLRKSESILAACRATPRRAVLTTALSAGAGAAAGYTVSTFLRDDVLTGAISVAVGMAVGLWFASLVSGIRMGRSGGFRASVATLVLTRQRLLVFRQSWLNNRAVELVKEYPANEITSIEVGPGRFVSPHPITVAFADGGELLMESARYEEPGRLAEAFAAMNPG